MLESPKRYRPKFVNQKDSFLSERRVICRLDDLCAAETGPRCVAFTAVCLPGNRPNLLQGLFSLGLTLRNLHVHGKPSTMSDCLERSVKVSLLKEPVVRRLCEVLDKSSNKGWRKLGEIVGNDRRFKVR